MTTHRFFLKNAACNESMIIVKNALLGIKGVNTVELFAEEKNISVSGIAIERDKIMAQLVALGYHDKENTEQFSKKNSFDFWYCHCCSSCDS